jgi:hypothetical protein
MKTQKKNQQRILGRTLAKELSVEELELVQGSRPPISTLVSTGENHTEDE